jgi:NAD(P)-dependent dehydrogenase (short-subunit alcohol dehydrogenase family)
VDVRLDGKVAVITGGSKGIGRAIAQSMVDAGCTVMLAARKEAPLAAAVDELGADRAAYTVANVGVEDDAARCVIATMERFGRIDILVNNAATNPHFGPLVELTASKAAKTTQVNMFAPVLWTGLVWRASMQERGGVVINVSSQGGYATTPGISYYSATKAALIHITRSLAWELAPTARVVGVAPGPIKTHLAEANFGPNESMVTGLLPLRRLGLPDEVGSLTTFLASDHAAWITGQTVIIDGGVNVYAPGENFLLDVASGSAVG